MEIDGEEVLFTITCVSNTSIKYLYIVWGGLLPHLAFCPDEVMKQFVKDNYEEIYNEGFNSVFGKLDDAKYYLNIASDEPMCNFPWNKHTRYLIEQQIETYKPLIQQFILDPDTYPKSKGK